MNPNASANLKPFRKGHDPRRNLKGRPTQLPELDVLMSDVLGSETEGTNGAREILEALVKQAMAGNVRAAEVLLNRAYGKPKKAVDITTNGQPVGEVRSIADIFGLPGKKQ